MLEDSLLTWPAIYPSINIIANWITPWHYNTNGAITFDNHLVSLGQNYKAKLAHYNFHAEFAYRFKISIFFLNIVLAHLVLQWAMGNEWMVLAHYTKNDV